MNRIRKIKSRATIALCLAILMAILIAALTSCENPSAVTVTDDSHYSYEVHTIDSCEYITYEIGSTLGLMAHKGNCRYCRKRNQVFLDSILLQIFD